VNKRGSVDGSAFYTKLQHFDVHEGKKDKLLANHMTQICQAHDRVSLFLVQQVQGPARPTTEGLRENIEHNVHVQGDVKRNTRSQSIKAGAVER